MTVNVYSRVRRAAALGGCVLTLSLGALAAAGPAQAAGHPGGTGPVPVPRPAASHPNSHRASSISTATDPCAGTAIVELINSYDTICYTYPMDDPDVGNTLFPYIKLVIWSNNRVWLHQNANGSGWADCFDNPYYSKGEGAVWTLTGTRDANPRDLLISLNTAPC